MRTKTGVVADALLDKLINSVLFGRLVDVAQLDHAGSVASRGRGISTCVKGGVTHCKH